MDSNVLGKLLNQISPNALGYLDKCAHDIRIEDGARCALNFLFRLGDRNCAMVTPLGLFPRYCVATQWRTPCEQSIKRIGNPQNTRAERDFVSFKTPGEACPVIALMLGSYDLRSI